MTKTQIVLFSVVVGIVYAAYQILKPSYEGDGFGEIAAGLESIFMAVILVPILFGIVSSVMSKERNLIQGLTAFGISFVIILAFALAAGAWLNAERERLHPSTEIPPVLDSERKR